MNTGKLLGIEDFDTFDDYVRYRETYGYTEEEYQLLEEVIENNSIVIQ